jgi:hypothetical protein
VSLLTRPLTEKSVDGSVSSKTIAVPYVLVLLAAVMVSVLALTVSSPRLVPAAYVIA